MKRLLTIAVVVVLSFVSGAIQAEEKQSFKMEAEMLTGTWNVVCKPTEISTCGLKKGDTAVYQWLVAGNSNDKIDVSVLGKTSFPSLMGKIVSRSTTLVIDGPASSPEGKMIGKRTFDQHVGSSFVFKMFEDNKLVGTRLYLATKIFKKGKGTHCFVQYDCTANKQ
jgi:hypothetical protein